jgi:hypothetical protein
MTDLTAGESARAAELYAGVSTADTRGTSRAYATWARAAARKGDRAAYEQHAASARFWRTVAAVKSRAART